MTVNVWEMSSKKIVFEFPTVDEKEVDRMRDHINGEKYLDEQIYLSVATDGQKGLELQEKYDSPDCWVVHCDPKIHPNWPISMTKLRMRAMRQTEALYSDAWSFIVDGDMDHRRNWRQILINAIADLPIRPFCDGVPMWINFRGFFGSSGVGDNMYIPRQLPLGSNLGILMSPDCRREFIANPPPNLPGGCEDPLFTLWATVKCGAIPFRKFKMPGVHPKKNDEHYGQSSIHNKDVIAGNNFALMKDICKTIIPEDVVEKWGGVPDNASQVGRVVDGRKLSPYCPGIDKWVVERVAELEAKYPEISSYRNW